MGLTASKSQHELRGVSPTSAISAWLQACRRAGSQARLTTETVPIGEALGRVLAEPVWARRSSPAFPAAAMDGIAVRAADTVGAAPGHPVLLAGATFELVDTGNPLHLPHDAVVMRERVHLEEGVAAVEAEVSPGYHVRSIGEDIAAGELLLAPGHRLGPVDLAAAAAAGVIELRVRRVPIVAILPTGDELRPAGADLAPGELADTNSLMLDGQAREAGCETRQWPIVADDPDRLTAELRVAAAEADLVLLVAGTSAGRHDHTPEVLRRCGRIVVRGVAMRPGHPAILGVVDHTPVLGCPGYPVSAALAFAELAMPVIAALQGAPVARRPAAHAQLAADVHSKLGTSHLLRVRLASVGGVPVAVPLRGGASVLTSLVHADALLPIPAERDALSAAAHVETRLLRSSVDLDDTLLLAGTPDLALDLLSLAIAQTGDWCDKTRVAFCEMAADDAVALVRDGLCHAAAISGTMCPSADEISDQALMATRLAECEVALAFRGERPGARAPGDLLRPGARVAVGPHGTPARRVFENAERPLCTSGCEIVEMRSDAAALATVTIGYADCAASTAAAARRLGLATIPLGHACLDLVTHRAVGERDPAIRVLLDTLRSPSLAAAFRRAGYAAGGVALPSADHTAALRPRVAREREKMKLVGSLEVTP